MLYITYNTLYAIYSCFLMLFHIYVIMSTDSQISPTHYSKRYFSGRIEMLLLLRKQLWRSLGDKKLWTKEF